MPIPDIHNNDDVDESINVSAFVDSKRDTFWRGCQEEYNDILLLQQDELPGSVRLQILEPLSIKTIIQACYSK